MSSIAVVIPIHNKQPHINRCLASVLSQTRPVDEIIVIDDASSDGSIGEIAQFTNERIRLLKRPVPGPGGYAARNLGILQAKSDWIAFLDADDAWNPSHIEKLSALIDTAPVGIGCAFSGYEIIQSDGTRSISQYSRRTNALGVCQLNFSEYLDCRLLKGGWPIWTGAVACRRTVLIEAGLFPEHRCRRGGDVDLWLRIMSRTEALSTPHIGATYFRDSVNMVTKTESLNSRHCASETIESMIETADPAVAKRLRKVYNLQMFNIMLNTVGNEELSPNAYRGFFVSENPIRYLLIKIFAALPLWVPRTLRRPSKAVRAAYRAISRVAFHRFVRHDRSF